MNLTSLNDQQVLFVKLCGGVSFGILFLLLCLSCFQGKIRKLCRKGKSNGRVDLRGGELAASRENPEDEIDLKNSLRVKTFEADDSDDEVTESSTKREALDGTDLETGNSSSGSSIQEGKNDEAVATSITSGRSPPRLLQRMLSASIRFPNNGTAPSTVTTTVAHRPLCRLCEKPFRGGESVCESSNQRCSHMFHEQCMAGWLRFQNTCPTCSETFVVLDRTA